jgi:hypothetical protein
LIDLALHFWENPDDKLLTGYRRLEGTIRERTRLNEHGTKLFAKAYAVSAPRLRWKDCSDGEMAGRANLFAGAFGAHRNPRAHKELKSNRVEQLSEFLLLNHLFRLERDSRVVRVARTKKS